MKHFVPCLICEVDYESGADFCVHLMDRHKTDDQFVYDSNNESAEDSDTEESWYALHSEESGHALHSEESDQEKVEVSRCSDTSFDEIINEELSIGVVETSQFSCVAHAVTTLPICSTPIASQSLNTLSLNWTFKRVSEIRRSNRRKKVTSKYEDYCKERKYVRNKKARKPVSPHVPPPSAVNKVIDPACQNTNYISLNTLLSNINDIFSLSSDNILQWLTEFQSLCANLKYPLPQHLYEKVKFMHKVLIDHYCLTLPSAQNNMILNVYENLNNMVLKHIESVNFNMKYNFE